MYTLDKQMRFQKNTNVIIKYQGTLLDRQMSFKTNRQKTTNK